MAKNISEGVVHKLPSDLRKVLTANTDNYPMRKSHSSRALILKNPSK